MSALRDLVAAWQRQSDRSNQAFEAALEGINRELDAVGGYATTSADTRGFCQSFYRGTDGWSFGIARTGERCGGTGPLADIVAPHHPEVGDRCLALEQEYRKQAMASTEAVQAVRQYIISNTGTGEYSEVEHSAIALCASEEAERALVVKWIRKVAGTHITTTASERNTISYKNGVVHDALLTVADEIERGEHLK